MYTVNRILLLLMPDKRASTLLWLLAVLSFLMGVLDLWMRDLDAAQTHLTLSVAIPAVLFAIKSLSLNATYRVAETARLRLHRQMQARTATDPRSPAGQDKARERAEMCALLDDLRQALSKIPADSPLRPKYEASVVYLERALRREAAGTVDTNH